MAAKRVIAVENHDVLKLRLPRGDVSSMDAFMKRHAPEVVLQNLRIEAKPGEEDVLFCYLQPSDAGPFRWQLRLTVRMKAESGKVSIDILNMEGGSVDKITGKATFLPASEAMPFRFETENVISWATVEKGQGLEVTYLARGKTTAEVPWWIPIPDIIIQMGVTSFLRQTVEQGQKQVLQQIEKRYASFKP